MARFILSVAPDTNIDHVAKIINKIGLKLASDEDWKDKILEAPHFVSMGDFNATSVDIIVSGKTQPSDQWAVIAEMRKQLLEEFEADGIYMGIGSNTVTSITPKKK